MKSSTENEINRNGFSRKLSQFSINIPLIDPILSNGFLLVTSSIGPLSIKRIYVDYHFLPHLGVFH